MEPLHVIASSTWTSEEISKRKRVHGPGTFPADCNRLVSLKGSTHLKFSRNHVFTYCILLRPVAFVHDPLASLQPRYMHTVKTPQQKAQKTQREGPVPNARSFGKSCVWPVWRMFKPHCCKPQEKLPSSVASLRGRLSCQPGAQVGKGWSPNVSNFVQFRLSGLLQRLWCCCQMHWSSRLCLSGCFQQILAWHHLFQEAEHMETYCQALKPNSVSCGWLPAPTQ